MLIKALSDFYDIHKQDYFCVDEGFEEVPIKFLICLNSKGQIENVISHLQKVDDNWKAKLAPRLEKMPRRSQKPGLDSNYPESRFDKIFGLEYVKGTLVSTDKAKRGHKVVVKLSNEFFNGISSSVVDAYLQFLNTWTTSNENIQKLYNMLKDLKDFDKGGYAFCLNDPSVMLHLDNQLCEKWKKKYDASMQENQTFAQCSISGQKKPIAQLHNKIKFPGGQKTGCTLVCFNNTAEQSYCKEQSFNSSISDEIMKKYTAALNYLLKNPKHKTTIGNTTIVFWSNSIQKAEELFSIIMGITTIDDTDELLKSAISDVRSGKTTIERILAINNIDKNSDFYIVGMSPNATRIAVKFIYKHQLGELLNNILKFQNELKIVNSTKTASIWTICNELVPPHDDVKDPNPNTLSKLLDAVIKNSSFPTSLLSIAIQRVKTDKKISPLKAGIIKSCLIRNYSNENKEEIKMSLDVENKNPAYLCGRLFAVLEKLQTESIGSTNRTIKDSYFASASTNPSIVFPKLLRLSQAHLKKLESVNKPTHGVVTFRKLIGEILNGLSCEFPSQLSLQDQGRFDIGYYQQVQDFFKAKETITNEEGN